jgi:hypothetical protein
MASKVMKTSNLSPWVRRSLALSVAALVLSPAMSRRAHAYGGGLWSARTAPAHAAAERILFVDNPDSTVTAIVQIQYAGPSRGFAWLVLVPGKPTVGVSSNAVFQRLDAATAPQYWVEVTVEGKCPKPDSPDAAFDAGSGEVGAPSAQDTIAAPVMGDPWAPAGPTKGSPTTTGVQIIDQGSIGPYDYVNIRVDPTLGDPTKVATDWLMTNGYDPTDLDGERLRRYLKDDLHLLALKLADGADVGAIRPVILTYESKLPAIPMEPTAMAAQGVQVWVVGPSQAVPDNTVSLVINDARLDWPTGRKYVAGTLPSGGVGPFDPYDASKPANYDAVVAAAAREAGGQGFVTELGAPASRYRGKVWSSTDDQHFATISSQRYADGIDAIFTASGYYRDWDGWKEAIEGATTLPAGLTIDEFGRNPDSYRGTAKVDSNKFFHLLDEKVVRPVADAAAMLSRAPYLTRLYSTVRPDSMTVDPAFGYNADLALVSDIHIARQFIQCGPTLDPTDAPWRIQLPQGGVVVGKGNGWPVAAGSMPANLEIVRLSTTGSGTLLKDNSDDIGMKLFAIAGTAGIGVAMPHPPQIGLAIGGTQTVKPPGQPGAASSSRQAPVRNDCTVSPVGADAPSTLARWLPQAALLLALRRRRSRRGQASRPS